MNDRLDGIDERLRRIEQAVTSLSTTQRIIGGILLVLIPVAIKLIDLL